MKMADFKGIDDGFGYWSGIPGWIVPAHSGQRIPTRFRPYDPSDERRSVDYRQETGKNPYFFYFLWQFVVESRWHSYGWYPVTRQLCLTFCVKSMYCLIFWRRWGHFADVAGWILQTRQYKIAICGAFLPPFFMGFGVVCKFFRCRFLSILSRKKTGVTTAIGRDVRGELPYAELSVRPANRAHPEESNARSQEDKATWKNRLSR